MEKNHIFDGLEVIDGHLHIHAWEDKNTGKTFESGIEEYKEKMGLRAYCFAAMASGYRDITNNVMCAIYKLLYPDTYAYGSLTFPMYPVEPEKLGDMDPLTQYEELMEIGFDGIKMLEGKPSVYYCTNLPLNHSVLDPFYERAAKDGTHILMHANDPIEFWDPEKTCEEHKKKGWFYGDGKHVAHEEIYRQVFDFMDKHPDLTLTVAHFFFLSERPEILEDAFRKYKNFGVDITPGGEMYIGFNKRYDYFKDFFTKYADRIMFGTDGDFPPCMEAMEWLCERIYKYVGTNLATDSWSDKPLYGIDLPRDKVNLIMSKNFLRKMGEKPKPINKVALKRYIEKYKGTLLDKSYLPKIEEIVKKYL